MASAAVAPHADVVVKDAPNGDFVVTAAPGMGYTYHWAVDGKDKPESKDRAEITVTPDPEKLASKNAAEKQSVTLEVTNAFGRTGSVTVKLDRPKSNSLEVGQN